MKRIIVIVLCLTGLLSYGQSIQQMQKYMKFAPSNMGATDVNPSDIPSEGVLRQMGLSEDEIQEAMNYKFQRGEYNPNFIDSSSSDISQIQSRNFYESLDNDTLFPFNDSIFEIHPRLQ